MIRLLVTDLDNTLYDWVTFFAESFTAMIDSALPIIGTDRERLLDDLKKVHQRYHNSEQPFALLEAECVQKQFPGLSRQELALKFDPAFHSFNVARNEHLKLYPGVLATLEAIQRSGCRIVAHTEATIVNAQFRLVKLGLTPFIHKLYAAEHLGESHPHRNVPQTPGVEQVRVLRIHERKPDPSVLLEICGDADAKPSETLYVGDSIARDIGMANAAGVHSAWARYGTLYNKDYWGKLVRITHWTEEDVRRAESAQLRYGQSQPEQTLDRFDQLLDQYTFG
jgi:FMN phosphatase YigB (HAD superfamily)